METNNREKRAYVYELVSTRGSSFILKVRSPLNGVRSAHCAERTRQDKSMPRRPNVFVKLDRDAWSLGARVWCGVVWCGVV